MANAIVAYAKEIGPQVKYVFGGNSPSKMEFDCSSFTKYVFKHFGYALPRTAAAQYADTDRVTRINLQPADLVFFKNTGSRGGITHVGIYISDGNFIQNSGRKDNVKISSLNETYYAQHFAGGGRVNGASNLTHSGGIDTGENIKNVVQKYMISGVSAAIIILIAIFGVKALITAIKEE